MNPLVPPDALWIILAVMMSGVAASIFLEQRYRWGARLSGPVLALVGAMILTNLKIMPVQSPTYDFVDAYLVPLAIPLLLFQANLRRIIREAGRMLVAFHVAAFGTLVGAFLAAFLFHDSFDRVPEVTGIMTGSYTGGGVNFMAVKTSYDISSELSNPLIVADNFIMAGMFAVLLVLAGSRFLLKHFPHPHTLAAASDQTKNLAAAHWRRKEIALIDIAKALAIAFLIVAVSTELSSVFKQRLTSNILQALLGNVFVHITFFTVLLSSLAPRWMDNIHGAEEIGVFLLYQFFFVIGLRADLVMVLQNVPVLFLFCLVMAVTNLVVTLLVGRLFKLDLEDLLVSVNATLGGPPSAAAMAIAKGWSKLVLPALLAGIWGYVIGTFLGILVAETLKRWLT